MYQNALPLMAGGRFVLFIVVAKQSFKGKKETGRVMFVG
jgi:hypothetical protein